MKGWPGMRRRLFTLVVIIAVLCGGALSAQLPGPPVGVPQTQQSTSHGYNFGYTFVPTGADGSGVQFAPTLRPTTVTAITQDGVRINPTFTLGPSAQTATTLAGLRVLTPTLNNPNSVVLTNFANLVIEAAPTGGTNNYSLWNKGTSRLDGNILSSTGGWTFASGTLTTSNPFAVTQTWNAGGVSFVGVNLAFTETASAAASNYFQILGGAAGTTSEFAVAKGGNVTALGNMTAQATTNQLVLGVTNTTTISAPAPAASMTLTLPNQVSASIPSGVQCVANTSTGLAAGGTCTNTAQGGTAHFNYGTFLLSANTSTVTFATGLGYTAATSYNCVANDITTRANPVQAVPATATTVTITNTTGATDLISMICVGY